MLREIIWRELLDYLQSLRFSVTLFLVIVLMLTGSVLYIHDYRQQVADYRENVSQNLQLLEDKAERGLHRLVSFRPTQLIYRSPSPLGFIAEGHEKDLPNAFGVDAFELVGPQTVLRRNYTLQRFDALDWVFSNIKYTFHSFPNSLAVAHECPSKIGISKKVICEATR